MASLPTTWATTWITDSAITGFIFPGMMELPGWTSGRVISPRPALGPEAMNRMSLAILCRLMAMVLSSPLASTRPSRVAWAWKWLAVSLISTPETSETILQARSENSS